MPTGVAVGAGFGALVGGSIAAGAQAATFWSIAGGALFGASIGSSMGALIDPPKDKDQNSPSYESALDRNTIATGIPIPVIYGKNRVWGNIFRQEYDSATQMNIWVGLGEGIINGIAEIRINNKLLVDLRDEETWDSWGIFPFVNSPGAIITIKESDGAYGRDRNYWAGAKVTILDGENAGKTLRCYASEGQRYYLANYLIRLWCDGDTVVQDETGSSCLIQRFCNQLSIGDSSYDEYKSIAWIYLEVSPTNYTQTSNVEVSSIVEGMKCFIPAGWPEESDVDRLEYTNNPSWCIYDFLAVDRPEGIGPPKILYGAGLDRDLLDLDSFKDAATYYDETMDDGGPRYECNYIIDSRKPVMDHLLVMMGACNSFLVFKDGKFYLKPQKGDDPVVQVFTNDNHRDLKYFPEGSDRRANQIKAKFTEAPYEYHAGTATNGGANTITLAGTASTADDEYNGMVIEILTGTGAGQVKDIIDYAGATKVAMVEDNWSTPPGAGSTYQIRKGNFEIIYVIVDDPIAQAEDGEVIPKEIDLLPCNRFTQAARIAQMHLDGIRLGNGVCQLIAGLNSVHCNPGDVIEINSSRLMWGNGCTQQAVCGNAACTGTYVECVEDYAATDYYDGDGVLFRILSIREKQEHRELEIMAKREHPGIYHDFYMGRQESMAMSARNPFYAPDPVTDLALTDAGQREADGKWRKGIGVSFVPPMDHFYKESIVSISYDGGDEYEEIARSAGYCTIFPKKDAVRSGIAESGTKWRLNDSALTDRNAQHFVGATILITEGTNAGQVRTIYSSGEGYVDWEAPMPDDIDDTSEYVISEYHVLVQSVNKFGIVCKASNSPAEPIALSSPPINLITNTTFDVIEQLKDLSPVAEFMEYAVGGEPLGTSPSLFVDLDNVNLGQFIAYIKYSILPYAMGEVWVNNTSIYSNVFISYTHVSIHSSRNGYAYLSLISNDLAAGELELGRIDSDLSNPISPITIDLGDGYPTDGFGSAKIHMIGDNNIYWVVYHISTDSVLFFRTNLSGEVVGSILTINNASYPDIITNDDGSEVYISYIWDGTAYLQRATGPVDLALDGSPIPMFELHQQLYWLSIEKINERLHFFMPDNREGVTFDTQLFIAQTDLMGTVCVDPYPKYFLIDEYNQAIGVCQGGDFFVGQYGVTTPESIGIIWMQDQYHIGDGIYQHFYQHRLKRIYMINNSITNLHANLI